MNKSSNEILNYFDRTQAASDAARASGKQLAAGRIKGKAHADVVGPGVVMCMGGFGLAGMGRNALTSTNVLRQANNLSRTLLPTRNAVGSPVVRMWDNTKQKLRFNVGGKGNAGAASGTSRKSLGDGLTKQKLNNYLEKVHEVPRNQLIKDLESLGLRLEGQSPDGLFKTFVDKSSQIRVKIHPPDAKSNYSHIHIYDKHGNSLTPTLESAPKNASEVHIEVKPISQELEWKP